MSKTKPVCPHCQSPEISRDGTLVWSLPEQKWEVAGEFDTMNCNVCDREFKSAKWVDTEAEASTGDIGLAIRDALEQRDFTIHVQAEDGELLHAGDATVQSVDVSDPNNLIVTLDNFQTFTVRILAGA